MSTTSSRAPPYGNPSGANTSRSSHPSGGSSNSGGHHSSQSRSGSHSGGGNTTNSSSSNNNNKTDHQHQHYREEDRLGRAWRSLASTVVMATQKAEKCASQLKPPSSQSSSQQPNHPIVKPSKESLKDLDESVVHFLKTRIEYGRNISHLEAKLQGKAKEMETMDCYLRSQPRLGRKRKRHREEADATGTAVADVDGAAAVAAVAVADSKTEPTLT